MKHKPSTATALFFDEVRPEANDKMSWMGMYSEYLYLLDPEHVPVDRLAVVAIIKWEFSAAPRSFQVELLLQGAKRVFPIQLPEPSPPPENLSPFAGLSVVLPLNLRIAPLAAGQTVEVWLSIPIQDDQPERYPLARLETKLSIASESSSPPKPKRRKKRPQA